MPNNPYNQPHQDRTRDPLVAPYECYNGAVITKQSVLDGYNSLSSEIHRWEDSGRGVPTHLLNARHRHFVIMADIAKGNTRYDRNARTLKTKTVFIKGRLYERPN